MQSTTDGKPYMRMKEVASLLRRCERMHSTPRAAMEASIRPGIVLLLFLASLVYIAFGGTVDVASPFETETSIAAVSGRPEDVGRASQPESLASIFSLPTETIFLPTDRYKQRRDGNREALAYDGD